jgi:hypothetical protein
MKPFLSPRLACVLAASLTLIGCGSGDDSETGATTPAGGSSAAGAGGSAGAGNAGSSAGTSGKGGTGGSSAGGAAGGGAAGQGGAGQSQGGAGQSQGGAGGAGGAGGGGMAVAQCKAGGDGCTLHSDCCNCLALGPGEEAPACDITECKASACELLGTPAVGCDAGQCTLAIGCSAAEVLCKSTPPTCAAGLVPGVADNCWTGQCVPVQECSHVGSCDPCKAAGLACVVDVLNSQYPIVHCVALPAACTGPTCECLGPAVCVDGGNVCTEQADVISCECPNC